MNIKTGVKFHNRFDIEVRDKDTGKLKQKAVAENIVLDRMYTRICNFNTYFSYIHFGTGTGDLTSSRTTLFSSLGNRAAVDEEKIKAYPVSKVIKRIRLEPEEYIGSIITEMGTSETTNAINTHALIKDSEGNPLSIEKTELDVVIIYATVFIELQDANDITFSKFNTNMLIDYFIDGSTMNPRLWLGDIGEPTEVGAIGFRIGDFPLTRSVDVANKKTSFSTRLGVDDANYDIRELSLGDICRVGLKNSLIWQSYVLTDVAIGVGDGESDTFDLGRYEMSNVVARVDGNVTNEYVLQGIWGNYRAIFPFHHLASPTANVDMKYYRDACVGVQEAVSNDVTKVWTIEVDENDIIGEKFEILTTFVGYGAGSWVYVYGSHDGESFTQIYHNQHSGTKTHSAEIENPYKYIRVSIRSGGAVYVDYIGWVNKNYERPQIIFNTPPAEGAIITADYTVPYIPKTSDYVLDVDFTLQFGEGL